jgi:hypothetical protein
MADATAYFLRSRDAKPAYHKIVYTENVARFPRFRYSPPEISPVKYGRRTSSRKSTADSFTPPRCAVTHGKVRLLLTRARSGCWWPSWRTPTWRFGFGHRKGLRQVLLRGARPLCPRRSDKCVLRGRLLLIERLLAGGAPGSSQDVLELIHIYGARLIRIDGIKLCAHHTGERTHG